MPLNVSVANTLGYYDMATIMAGKSFLAQAPGVNFMNNLLLQLLAIENKQTWKPTCCMKKGMSGKAAVYFAKSVEQTFFEWTTGQLYTCIDSYFDQLSQQHGHFINLQQLVTYVHAMTHILTRCHSDN